MGEFNQATVKNYQDTNGRKPQRIRTDSITAAIAVPCPKDLFLSVQPELFHAEFPSVSDFLPGNIHPKISILYCGVPAMARKDLLTQCAFVLLLPVKAACGSCVFCCQQCHVLGTLRVGLLTRGAGKPT